MLLHPASRLVGAAIAAFASALVQAPMLAAQEAPIVMAQNQARPPSSINIVNRSGKTLQIAYLAPVDSADWGDDVLGSDTVENGGRFRASLPARSCAYDFRGGYEDGQEITLFGLNLCRNPQVVLERSTRSQPLPRARDGVALFRVVNRTGGEILTLHLAAAGSRNEGPDVLGAVILPEGGQFTGRVEQNGSCRYDIVARYERGRDPVRLSNQNPCETREIVLDTPARRGNQSASPGGTPPASGGEIRATIVNNTGDTIEVFNLAAGSATEWGSDRLGNDVLQSGSRFEVRLSRGECVYDFRGSLRDGREVTRFGHDFCRANELVLAAGREPDLPGQRPGVSIFRVVNQTGATVQTLHIFPTGETQGEDVLGASVLPDRQRFTGRVSSEAPCLYDIRATLQRGGPVTLARQNLCETRVVELNQRGRTNAAPSSTAGEIRARIVNNTDDTIQVFNLARPNETSWGVDRLGSEVLEAGNDFEVRLPRGQCVYDFRGTLDGGREITRFGHDFCRSPELTIASGDPDQALPAPRDGVAIFRVVNRTGTTVQTLHVFPTGSSRRGEDVLGASVLSQDDRFTGRVSSEAPCLFDIRATLNQGGPITLTRQNLCETREVVLNLRGGAQQSGNTRPFVIVNRGRVTIQTAHMRAAGERGWGEDRLGSSVISRGERFTIRLPDAPCEYAVRVTYAGGGSETRQRHNVCETPELAFNGPAGGGRVGREKSATAAETNDPSQASQVTIVNRSQLVIEELNISSSRVSDWGEDHLGAGVIEPGARFSARIQRDGQCDYDVRVRYRGGREERRMRQNICEAREIAFAGPNSRVVDGGGPESGRLVRVLNDGPVELRELYISPTSNTHWGEDVLGSETLPRRHRFEIRLEERDGCAYDLRAVFSNGGAQERRGVDLCANPEQRFARPHPAGTLISTGTGFYITSSGHILTNQHVVDGCTAVGIHRPSGERIMLRVLAADEDSDLALLRHEGADTRAMAFRPADSAVRAGDRVVIVGWPARQELGHVNVTEGLVAGQRGMRGSETEFQYTAPTQAGNSGGPVFDEAGRVIGVVVAQLSSVGGRRQAQNVNFGIRQEVVRRFLQANGVTPTDEAAAAPLRPADILDRSLPSVLPLDCIG